jgi:hypothetical protein
LKKTVRFVLSFCERLNSFLVLLRIARKSIRLQGPMRSFTFTAVTSLFSSSVALVFQRLNKFQSTAAGRSGTTAGHYQNRSYDFGGYMLVRLIAMLPLIIQQIPSMLLPNATYRLTGVLELR